MKEIFLVLLLLFSGSAGAQFVNGTFSNNGSDWDWKRHRFISSGTTGVGPGDCYGIGPSDLVDFPPGASHLFSRGGGNIAVRFGTPELGTPLERYTYGRYEIQQDVVVPRGHWLKFDHLLGKLNFSATTLWNYPVSFFVLADNLQTGEVGILVYTRGIDYDSDTAFLDTSAKVGELAGVEAKFRFVACGRDITYATGIGTNYDEPAGWVHLDNIRFEPLPIKSSANPLSGNWYNPARSGHGFHFSRDSSNRLGVIWYTYKSNGQPIWYISDFNHVNNGVWNGKLDKATRSTSTGAITLTRVADLRFEFTEHSEARMFWDLYSVNGNGAGWDGSEYIEHFLGGDSYTGHWYEPGFSGWGFTMDYESGRVGSDGITTVFLYDGSQPVWVQGDADGTPQFNRRYSLNYYTSTGLCPQCSGSISVSGQGAGSIYLNLSTGSSGTGYSKITLPSGRKWYRGSSSSPVSFGRLTSP